MSDLKLSKDLLGYSYEYLYPSESSEKKDVSKNSMNRFEEAYSSQKNRYSTSPKQYYMEESIFEESLSTNSSQADKKLNPVNGEHSFANYIPKEETQATNSSQVNNKLTPVNGEHGFTNYIPKEETEKASKTKEKSVEKSNKTTTENPVEKTTEKSNESPKDKSTENPVKEQKEVSKDVKPAEKVEKTKKTKKTKTKPTGNGKRFNFFKGKKGKFGAILAGIALVGAAIAYVVNKAGDKVGDKVDKAKDVKAEKPVENTTQIEETPEIVEPIPVAPVEAPVQEENDSDVVTVKPGDTVWDLCEQKLKERGNGNPTAKQIRELVDKVMADEKNKLHWESDNYTVIIKPEQKIRICKPEEYSS